MCLISTNKWLYSSNMHANKQLVRDPKIKVLLFMIMTMIKTFWMGSWTFNRFVNRLKWNEDSIINIALL